MTIEEYLKLKIKHLIFPSGLEVDIKMPSLKAVLPHIYKTPVDLIAIIDEVGKGFPDNLSIEDLIPEDFVYLIETIKSFFGVQPFQDGSQSPNGLENTHSK